MFESIGFIGAGRIARIMLGGWQRAGGLSASVKIHEQNAEVVAALKRQFPHVESVPLAEAASCDLVFGALHPPALLDALAEISRSLKPKAVFCSLSPKIKFATLREKLGDFGRLAKQNPNAPSLANAGFNPIAFGEGLPQAEREAILALMAPLGQCPEVEESTIETYAVISAMGPTYLWFQFQAIRELAIEFGLSAEAANIAVESMIKGATETLFHGGLPAQDVMDLVPVRPMGNDELAIRTILETRLRAIHAKLLS